MITNPSAKRILCFGDSNTWGQMPDAKRRYPANIRWTGLLQIALGDSCEVIEEGLSSRTTDLDYQQYGDTRNGKKYLKPCLLSQRPLDLVLLMIGSNDCKVEFGPRPAIQIAKAVSGLVDDIIKYGQYEGQIPKIALISPIGVNPKGRYFKQIFKDLLNEQSIQVCQSLSPLYEQLARQRNLFFADAVTVAKAGEDGVHLTPEGHKAIAELLIPKIKEWLK